jgi:aminoglycoside phosphotransferase (APT) family kinase protein
MRQTATDDWRLQASDHDEYVFCHNDLSQQNVIVDPDTLKSKAIIDWEYAGFYPAHFEMPFYTRFGPSIAIKDEADDSAKLLAFFESRAEVKPDSGKDALDRSKLLFTFDR